MFTSHNIACPNPEPDSGEHRVAYCQWGDPESKKTLLCIHGLARNARDFEVLAEAMSAEYHVLAIDMPGRGESEWLQKSEWYNYPTYIADISYILDKLNITKFDWVGTSMGGIIGMTIAAMVPDKIGKLILNDIGTFIPKKAMEYIASYVGKDVEFTTKQEAEAVLYETYYAGFGMAECKPEHWQHFLKHSIKASNGSYIFHYDPKIGDVFKDDDGKILPLEDINLWSLWENIACPVFLMRGRKSDILLAKTAQEMQASGKLQDILEINHCGHAPSLMEDGQISVIKKWLGFSRS